MVCANYSEVDQKKISHMHVYMYVCVYVYVGVYESENKCGRMLKIGDYEWESCPLFLQLWVFEIMLKQNKYK